MAVSELWPRILTDACKAFGDPPQVAAPFSASGVCFLALRSFSISFSSDPTVLLLLFIDLNLKDWPFRDRMDTR